MKVTNTEKLPIKMWLEDVEDSALEQIMNLANLPFAYKHIAIMPDCHKGYGMPVGGVMATNGVVIPNAVGTDIGCFDKDTEFLSPEGWKKISKWKNELVAQFDPDFNVAYFVRPQMYIKEKCDKFIKIKTKYGVDQVLSDEHRCLIYKYDKSGKFNKREVMTAKEIKKKHNKLKLGFRPRFLTSFEIDRGNQKIDMSSIFLKINVMFSADGSYNHTQCTFNFKKERKIKRAKKLLKSANILFTEHKHKDGVTRLAFRREHIQKKGLEQFWKASKQQLKIIADECLFWDGDQNNCFYTRRKKEADFINYAFAATGKYRSVMRSDKHKKDGKLDYRVFRYKNTKVGIYGTPKTKITYIKSEDGFKYCFRVPSSFLVMRRNGNIFISGNCGMSAIRTSLTELNINNLKTIVGKIRELVPVGFNHQKEPQEFVGFALAPDIRIIQHELNSARKQLGTLGGGNHFIEIQKGSDGFIWAMVHSGSRNFGLKIANEYNKIAQNLCSMWHSNIPAFKGADGLAFLPIETYQAKEYMLAMQYALRFAYENRLQMMNKIKTAFTDVLTCEFEKEINIHHNYAQWENHFGKNVIVHRKGATSARLGEIGIIPGSQGTASYIVEGKGNPQSFMSCSHGAGRVMSRNQAKKELNLENEKKLLEDKNIVHSIRTVNDLDEASSAYKDIDVVMENQKELVDIKVKLTPLGVIKG